jgi:hypothetical protein
MQSFNLQVTQAIWENYLRQLKKLMKGSWKADATIKNKKAVDSLIRPLASRTSNRILSMLICSPIGLLVPVWNRNNK